MDLFHRAVCVYYSERFGPLSGNVQIRVADPFIKFNGFEVHPVGPLSRLISGIHPLKRPFDREVEKEGQVWFESSGSKLDHVIYYNSRETAARTLVRPRRICITV